MLGLQPDLFYPLRSSLGRRRSHCCAPLLRSARRTERSGLASLGRPDSLAILYLFGIATIQSYFTSNAVLYYWILNTAWFLAPLGLTYALLKRRLLDVGFVLNRAVS